MKEHSDDLALGSLVIVEAGATVPREIFTLCDCSDHAVVRQSEGEPLPSVLSRAQHRIWEFRASSVRPANILVVLREAWTAADMLERERLGRSLLELRDVEGAQLTFRTASEDERLAVTLLNLVAALVEGTRDCSVSLAIGPGPRSGRTSTSAAASA